MAEANADATIKLRWQIYIFEYFRHLFRYLHYGTSTVTDRF